MIFSRVKLGSCRWVIAWIPKEINCNHAMKTIEEIEDKGIFIGIDNKR